MSGLFWWPPVQVGNFTVPIWKVDKRWAANVTALPSNVFTIFAQVLLLFTLQCPKGSLAMLIGNLDAHHTLQDLHALTLPDLRDMELDGRLRRSPSLGPRLDLCATPLPTS